MRSPEGAKGKEGPKAAQTTQTRRGSEGEISLALGRAAVCEAGQRTGAAGGADPSGIIGLAGRGRIKKGRPAQDGQTEVLLNFLRGFKGGVQVLEEERHPDAHEKA